MHPSESVPDSGAKHSLEFDEALGQTQSLRIAQTPAGVCPPTGVYGSLAGEFPTPGDIRIVFSRLTRLRRLLKGATAECATTAQRLKNSPRRSESTDTPADLGPPCRSGGNPQGTQPNSGPIQPAYVVIAGNRRLHAARLAGLESVPCIIRVTDGDEAFILNVVENLQRRQLSGRERVRALVLLAGLTDESGRTFGVREISRLTGLAAGTISTWLRIHRRPVLEEALDDERVDIGRAMGWCPRRQIPARPDRARQVLSQQDLATEVAAAKGEVAVRAHTQGEPQATVVDVGMPADERHALAAYKRCCWLNVRLNLCAACWVASSSG